MKKELLFIIVIVAALGFGYVLIKGKNHISSSSLLNNGQAPTLSANTTNDSRPGSIENVAAETAASQIPLTVSSPASNSTVASPTVSVSGKTTAGAEVFANDQIGRADNQGNFYFQVSLDEGENEILILANDKSGNSAEKDIVVTYQPSQ